MDESKKIVLDVRNLKQHFVSGRGRNKLVVKAVDGISFQIHEGEVFGLVGESGCGKTTTGRSIIRLYDPTDGEVLFRGKRIGGGTLTFKNELKVAKAGLKAVADKGSKEAEEYKEQISKLRELIREVKNDNAFRGDTIETLKKIQMIFQDPISSLNPRMTVREIIAEGLIIAGEKNKSVLTKKVQDILQVVGLQPEHAFRYPHEFSGGQRQRIGVARALIIEPELLIADEPISSLDVSIQAQVINLLKDLQAKLNLTILFIAHDLSVVKYFSDRIAVMYFGHIVEVAESDLLFKNPLHPYTRSLLSAIPLPDPDYEKTRVRFDYDPRTHQYGPDNMPEFVEIEKGHFILASPSEVDEYRGILK